MKKYAIFIALAAMLCGTEAGATPLVTYQNYIDGIAQPLYTHSQTITSNFQLFASPTPALSVDKFIIGIEIPGGELGTSFYIDNIKVTADLGSGSLQTIGFDGLFDGGVFGSGLPLRYEVPVPGGTEFDKFEIVGQNFDWAVSPAGNPGNSVFVTPGSYLRTELVITLPERYTRQEFEACPSPCEFQAGQKKGVDSAFSFFFHSADLKIGTSQPDPNGGSVPEPASLLLLGAGLAGIVIWRRKGWR